MWRARPTRGGRTLTVPRRIEQPSVTLATRVPQRLRRAVKVHCTERRIQVQHFVIEAIEERLAKLAGKGGSPRR